MTITKKLMTAKRRAVPSLEERGLTQKDILQHAQRAKNDEFYTRYEDVSKELSMYHKSIWNNKIVYCNCDAVADDNERKTSAFALYFLKNFNNLKIKKLICTHYAGGVDLFEQGPKGSIFTKEKFREIKEYPKGYTGSFDHPLSLNILHEEADIVCTNPPFSRAADFWRIMIESGKHFIIISNIINTIRTPFIPYFKDHKVWAGYNEVDWYLTPKNELTRAAGFWFTNFPIKNRPRYKLLKIMPLEDIPSQYKRYDDSNVLLVDNCYIPNDYKEPFAVSARTILNGLLEIGYKIVQDKRYTVYLNGKEIFARVLVQKIE